MLTAANNPQTEGTTPPDRRQLDQLLIRIGTGQKESLARLYDLTRGAVYGVALSYLKRAEEARDVTQDVYVRIWEAAPGYRSQGAPMAWILTIARNLARMRLRAESRLVELEEAQWEAIPEPSPAVEPEDRQLLQQAMARLGEEERRIVILHAVSGLKHREIGALLELPLPTVLSKYRRALKKLKTYMEGDENS